MARLFAIAAIGLGLGLATSNAPVSASDCSATSIGATPLDELGAGLYRGLFQGGLYEGGSNAVPADHAALGLARAAAVQPLDAIGLPSASGSYVLLSIGLSNTTQEFCSQSSSEPCDAWTFMGRAALDSRVNRDELVIVNGARGGQTAVTWDNPSDPNYDFVRDQRLTPKGVSEAQVQIVWLKVANPNPTLSLPAANADARILEAALGRILRALRSRYPNLRLVFVSSRIYAGYANVSTLNPEPFAYESGFAVKWLIEAQIEQLRGAGIDPIAGNLDPDGAAAWLTWGPYLWADGTTPRSDGLVYDCADLEFDGTHPSQSGEAKVAERLLEFMLMSPFSVPWFRSAAALPALSPDRLGWLAAALIAISALRARYAWEERLRKIGVAAGSWAGRRKRAL